MFSRGHGSQTA